MGTQIFEPGIRWAAIFNYAILAKNGAVIRKKNGWGEEGGGKMRKKKNQQNIREIYSNKNENIL